MADQNSLQTAQFIGWAVTFAAFAGNMWWNFKNRQHSNKLASEIRQEQYSREIWSRHRSQIEERLEEFVSGVCGLPGQLRALDELVNPAKSIDLWGYQIMILHDALSRALRAADENTYCRFADWEDAANGRAHNSEASWDILMSLFELAKAENGFDGQIEHIKRMAGYAMEIEGTIRVKIRDVDFLYQPC